MNGKRTKRKRELEKEERLDRLLKNPPKDEFDTRCSLAEKIDRLVDLIKSSKNVLVITGAGISTAANIPDYRGVEGLYTKNVDNFDRSFDIRTAIPTKTHMIIKEMMTRNYISHLISQNCDGLHLRSGIPQNRLSEIHGNMYIEYCKNCEKQFIRPYEVSFYSDFRQHETIRCCNMCRRRLTDTIVHAGEKSSVKWPQNWDGAMKSAKIADLIVIIGTSGVVLKNYDVLWPENVTKVIVNTQPTMIDDRMDIVLRAKCDDVMDEICQKLEIDADLNFCRNCDMILNQPRRPQYDKIMSEFTKCECAIRIKQSLVLDSAMANFGCPGWLKNGLKRMRRLYIEQNKDSADDSSSSSEDDDYRPNKLKKYSKHQIGISINNGSKSASKSVRLVQKDRKARLIEENESESNSNGSNSSDEEDTLACAKRSNGVGVISAQIEENLNSFDSPPDISACLMPEDCEQEVMHSLSEKSYHQMNSTNFVNSTKVEDATPPSYQIDMVENETLQEMGSSNNELCKVETHMTILISSPTSPLKDLICLPDAKSNLSLDDPQSLKLVFSNNDDKKDENRIDTTHDNNCPGSFSINKGHGEKEKSCEKSQEVEEEGENQKEGGRPRDDEQTQKGDNARNNGSPQENGSSGERSDSGSSGGSPNGDDDQPREPPKGQDQSSVDGAQELEEEDEEDEDEDEETSIDKKSKTKTEEQEKSENLKSFQSYESKNVKTEGEASLVSHTNANNRYGQFEFPMPLPIQPISLPQISLAPVVIPTLTLPIRTFHPIAQQSGTQVMPTIPQLSQIQPSDSVQQVSISRPSDPDTPPARFPIPQFQQLNFDPLVGLPSSNAHISLLNRLSNPIENGQNMPSVSNANFQENILGFVPPIIPPSFDLNQFLVDRSREMEIMIHQQNQQQDNLNENQLNESEEETRRREHAELIYLRQNEITPPALLDPEARRNFVYDRPEDNGVSPNMRDNNDLERRQIVAEADSTVDNAHLPISVQECYEQFSTENETTSKSNVSDISGPKSKMARLSDTPGPSNMHNDGCRNAEGTSENISEDRSAICDENLQNADEDIQIDVEEISADCVDVISEETLCKNQSDTTIDVEKSDDPSNQEHALQNSIVQFKNTVTRNNNFTEPDFDENFLEGDDDDDQDIANVPSTSNLRPHISNMSIPGPSREPDLTLLTSNHVGLTELRDDDMHFLDNFGEFDQAGQTSSFGSQDDDIGAGFSSLTASHDFTPTPSLSDFQYDYTMEQPHPLIVSQDRRVPHRNTNAQFGSQRNYNVQHAIKPKRCSPPQPQVSNKNVQPTAYTNMPGPSRTRTKEESIEETINSIVDRVTKEDVNQLFAAVQGTTVSLSRRIANTAVFSRLDDYPVLPVHERNERQENFEEVMSLVFSIYAPAFSLTSEEFSVFRNMFIERFGYTTGALQLNHIRNMIRHFKTDHCRK